MSDKKNVTFRFSRFSLFFTLGDSFERFLRKSGATVGGYLFTPSLPLASRLGWVGLRVVLWVVVMLGLFRVILIPLLVLGCLAALGGLLAGLGYLVFLVFSVFGFSRSLRGSLIGGVHWLVFLGLGVAGGLYFGWLSVVTGVVSFLIEVGRWGRGMLFRSRYGALYLRWANARSEWFWDINYGLRRCAGVFVIGYLWHCWVASVLLTFFLWVVVWFLLTWMADKYELWTLELPALAYPRFYRLCAHVAQFVYCIQIVVWPYLDCVMDWYLRCIHDGLKFHSRVNFVVEKAWFSFFFSVSGIVGVFSFVPSFIGEGLSPLV